MQNSFIYYHLFNWSTLPTLGMAVLNSVLNRIDNTTINKDLGADLNLGTPQIQIRLITYTLYTITGTIEYQIQHSFSIL